MKLFLAISLLLASLLRSQGQDDNFDNLQPISHADRCSSQPCEDPQWKRQTCCEGYVCIQPQVYEEIQTPRCVNKASIPAIGPNWELDYSP